LLVLIASLALGTHELFECRAIVASTEKELANGPRLSHIGEYEETTVAVMRHSPYLRGNAVERFRKLGERFRNNN
jgi:hypothetical protein